MFNKTFLFLLWLFYSSAWGLADNASENSARLNLENADINAVIATVAELTGKNFIVDPKVRGKVTIISGKEMSVKDLYEIFLSVLQVHGYAAIPDGNAIKIIPDVTAKYVASNLIDDRGDSISLSNDIVSRVVDIVNVSASKLVPILRPLVSPKGHIVEHASTNTLVILDRKSNIDHLQKIITRIDQKVSDDIEIVALSYVSAPDIVRVIERLYQKAKGQEKLSSVIVIADDNTNSILIGGDRSERLQVKAIIAHLDAPKENTGDTEVIYLQYAKSKDLAAVLSGLGKDYVKEKKKNGGGVTTPVIVNVHAYEDANALVINAPDDLMKSMKRVIALLDVRRAQVLVEAIIAEVSTDKNNNYGIQWAVDGASNGNGPIGVVNFGALGGIVESVSNMNVPTGAMLGVGAFGSDQSVNFAMFLSAMSGDSDNNILSTPSIITVDNEEAEIVVAENVPFITGKETSSSSGTNNPFQTVERRDVGLTLKVKPQINQDGTITMDIRQEVSQVKDQSVGAAKDISTTKRSMKTTVLVDDGQVIVLGGLMDEQVDEAESKVPLLGDLPILGAAFKYSSGKIRKRNLMVFIKTSIIMNNENAFDITKKKYEEVRRKQLSHVNNSMKIINHNGSPVLPDFDDLLELPPVFVDDSQPIRKF